MKTTRQFSTGAAVLLAGLLVGLQAQAASVTMATEGAYPPFNKTEANGEFSGFEIELGDAVCAKAELDCAWIKQDFSGMVPALLSGKFDLIFSAMSITPDREKVALFSIPYLNDGFRFYGPKSSGAELGDDLDGKRIGVLTGSSGEQFVQEQWPDAETVGYADMDQVNSDLEAGRIDYGFNAQLPVDGFLKSDEGADFAFVGPTFSDPILGKGMGAMFRPDETDLKDTFDTAIKAVYEDGTFEKLSVKYFGDDVDVSAEDLW